MTITLRTILAGIERGWRRRQNRRRLQALPDFMLKDIGISRSGIDYVATAGECRRSR
jgi:uncharacterized protein YjiS (DUF1127 family)